jgi:putative chitinase
VTPEELHEALPCTVADAEKWAGPLTAAMEEFDINTPARQAAFVAQVGHESACMAHLVENLNYSADGLCKVWPARFQTFGDAATYARKPEAIANRVYADRMGNGPTNSGDGWRYHGRGLIQATGKDTYRSLSAALDIDLLANPERLEEPELAARSAGWFWSTHGCNERADVDDFAGITRKINGGMTGNEDRFALWDRAKRALGVA